MRQLRGVLVFGLKIILCIVLGLWFNVVICLVVALYGCLFGGNFVGFYFSILSYVRKFSNPIVGLLICLGDVGMLIYVRVCSC